MNAINSCWPMTWSSLPILLKQRPPPPPTLNLQHFSSWVDKSSPSFTAEHLETINTSRPSRLAAPFFMPGRAASWHRSSPTRCPMDQLIHFVKSKKGAVAVRDFCVVRYWCLKQSTWRGKYRRIFCVSPSALFTQRDNEDLAVTNTYALVGDVDVESIGPGKGDEDIIIIGRADKKVSGNHPSSTCCADSYGWVPIIVLVLPWMLFQLEVNLGSRISQGANYWGESVPDREYCPQSGWMGGGWLGWFWIKEWGLDCVWFSFGS